MDAKRFVGAWVAATAIGYVLSWLWHVVLMGEQYRAATAAVARPEGEVQMGMVVLGYVVLGALMAYTFPIGAKGGSPAGEGFRFGALIGLLWILPWSLVMVGIWQVGLRIALIDAVWHIVEEGLAGIGVAYVYGMGAAAPAAVTAAAPSPPPPAGDRPQSPPTWSGGGNPNPPAGGGGGQ